MKPCLLLCCVLPLLSQDLFESLRNGKLPDKFDIHARDNAGRTPLHYAAVFLSAAEMRTLLSMGADANARSKNGTTPLLASVGDLEKVQLLVAAGASLDAAGPLGSTPLRQAILMPGGAPVIRHLITKGAKADGSHLVRALQTTGDPERVAALLENGVPITAAALVQSARSPGLMAELSRRAPEVKLEAGSLGDTPRGPLMRAAYNGDLFAVERLLGAGANASIKDNRERTLFMYAHGANTPNPRLIEFLARSGADASAKDVRGDTASAIAAGVPAPVAHRKPGPLREALNRALRVLEPAGPRFYESNGCISCHNQSIPQMAARAAQQHGLETSEKVRVAQSAAFETDLSRHIDAMWTNNCAAGGGFIATITYGLAGQIDGGGARTLTTELVASCVANAQSASGAWRHTDIRQPLGLSDPKFTAFAIRSLRGHPLPGRAAEFERRIASAARYLETTQESSVQDLAMRILGLEWAGRKAPASLRRQLLAARNTDGGWPQLPGKPSDAYATALATWALRDSKGAAWLRETQLPDGSWHVRSRGFGFQPYRETGFPHGHDQWISSAATGFAILALTQFL